MNTTTTQHPLTALWPVPDRLGQRPCSASVQFLDITETPAVPWILDETGRITPVDPTEVILVTSSEASRKANALAEEAKARAVAGLKAELLSFLKPAEAGEHHDPTSPATRRRDITQLEPELPAICARFNAHPDTATELFGALAALDAAERKRAEALSEDGRASATFERAESEIIAAQAIINEATKFVKPQR